MGGSMAYGNIMEVQTTGASKETAEANSLKKGVTASHKMAEMDAERMKKYMPMIKRVGKKYKIDPALIAAIISRESRAGKALKKGWGDYDKDRKKYKAWGLMQVDVDPKGGAHTPLGDWDSEEHLCQGTEILVHFIKLIRNKDSFEECSTEEKLKGGIAAYNQGDRKVHSYGTVDDITTGKDYSNDVVARAQWYKNQESWCTLL